MLAKALAPSSILMMRLFPCSFKVGVAGTFVLAKITKLKIQERMMTDGRLISDQEIQQKVIEALSKLGGSPTLFGEYIVDGDKSWSIPFMTVKKLTFKRNSRLIFDETVTRAHKNLFIFAERIVSEDQQELGEVTWVDIDASVPPIPGYGASGGNMGGVESATGGPGAAGPDGFGGENGADAPSLTIVVKDLAGGLKIGLRGEVGGTGGPGGVGGSGGQGRIRYACKSRYV